ncbi:hypothetical protein MFIFM68171_11057 [Madurella fahalii]|uniref:Hemerythrin-like domain-containing protein n=1 Tax=Madurella fahalii TaxID=1157608 RepID=A0ABQ0GT18_9PEZI
MAEARANECAGPADAESSTAESRPDHSLVAPGNKGCDTGAGSDSVSIPGGGSEPGAGSASGPRPETAPEPEPEPTLPPLTPQEFRIYNRLAEQMDYFHEHFRKTFRLLHQACITGRRPQNLTLKQFLDQGLNLVHYLSTHHTIEETHLYPLLARKMPEFRAASHHHHQYHGGPSSSRGRAAGSGTEQRQTKKGGPEGDCELLRQHREIHRGMDEFEAYLRRCKNRECELELSVLKEKMDSWAEVLLRHLDQEVRDLGAENMRRYWTLEEMRAFPI